ncbi:SNF2 family N-terminal domain protein [Cryptosporidium meleagridis]|uniref:SNF2 family N-terminal domain protein n=1 Tax=Cryptosporidium meleagridis TaxID=93969 RepID=A0A2P4Z286_9CRYT|nr:SNF2 family N-terminal domain protein [Cryptosporidium meleagridis]
MVRFKARPFRYGGVSHQDGECFILENKLKEEEKNLDLDCHLDFDSDSKKPQILSKKEELGIECNIRQITTQLNDLVCCLNTWENLKMTIIPENEKMDLAEIMNSLNDQSKEFVAQIGFSRENKSKCELLIFNREFGKESTEFGPSNPEGILARGSFSWLNFKPKMPYFNVRKALILLQDAGFLSFACEVLAVKKSYCCNIGNFSTVSSNIATSSHSSRSQRIVVNINFKIYLNRASLDGKLLSRKKDAKNSFKLLFSWLNEETRLPSMENSTNNQIQNKKKSLQAVQIKPNELYSIFQEYNISVKRMGSSSNTRKQNTDWTRQLGLVSELRNYQKDAVLFALCVEKESVKLSIEYPPYWYCLKIPKKEENQQDLLYFNIITGELSFNILPSGGGHFAIRGGFLCDEMGLGKSLEIIALILMNPRTEHCLFNNKQQGFKRDSSFPLLKHKDHNNSKNTEVECPCGISKPLQDYNVVECEKCQAKFHFECCISDNLANFNDLHQVNLLCSLCQSIDSSEKLMVKGTLIIAPGSIVDQWYDEFNKHLEEGRLKVVKYQGVRYVQNFLKNRALNKLKNTDLNPMTSGNGQILTRRDILNYDVVLTSYEILKEEIYHVLDENAITNKRSMRFKKSYPILASLITNIDWWRVVLDEAQMTEGYSLVSRMTSKLTCCNKWCVSGTPIVRSCSNDLIGLLLNLSNVGFDLIHDTLYKKYIGYLSSILYIKSGKSGSEDQVENQDHPSENEKEPLIEEKLLEEEKWLSCESGLDYVTSEYVSMMNLIRHLEYVVGSLFYRREMKQVKEEIRIPPAFYGNTYLGLSSVERFFYIKQCESGYNGVMNYKSQESFLRNKKEMDSLITMLRLACIHPQLGIMGIHNKNKDDDGKFYNLNSHNDTTIASLNTGLKIMTMDQILDKLLNKCRIDIEESVRKYVMNTLGLAGIHFAKKLKFEDDGNNCSNMKMNKSAFYYRQVLDIRKEDRVDVLQQIHTLWNLGEICNDELEKKELMKECSDLESKYTSKYYEEYMGKHDLFVKSKDKANSLFSDDHWWYIFKKLNVSTKGGISEEDLLLNRIESFQYEFKSAKDGSAEHNLPSFNSIHGLIIALDLKVKQMQESRTRLLDQVKELELLRFNNVQDQNTCSCSSQMNLDLNQSQSQNLASQQILDEIIAKVSSCFSCQQGQSSQLEESRQQIQRQESCIFCVIQVHIEELEYSLYTIKKKTFTRVSGTSSSNQSTEIDKNPENKTAHHDSTYLRDSETVAILKFLNKELRKKISRSGSNAKEQEEQERELNEMEDLASISKISTKHIKYIESLKIELYNSKAFVSASRQLINSYLELIDCKQRIQIIQDNKLNSSSNHNNIIHISEVPGLIEKYESERMSALGVRRNLKSQQKFLCNLKLQQRSKKKCEDGAIEESQDDDICPICLNRLKYDYSQVLLPCAHIICIDCYTLIGKKSSNHKFKNQCPKCRLNFQDTSVVLIVPENDTKSSRSLIDESVNKPNQVDFGTDNFKTIQSIEILGNFGSKIEAIIKHIKWILRNNNDKIIIFSDFQSVIDILSSAMHLNEILFKKYSGGKSEYHIIREFSSLENSVDTNYRVLLCNHLNVGKGVNITAANHIIFVSPLLNKSDELQAIGRIIRMGQTKTPHIWNFIIHNSIDELIFQYLSNFYANQNPHNPLLNSNNQHSLNLKIIQHVSDTNFKQREQAVEESNQTS